MSSALVVLDAYDMVQQEVGPTTLTQAHFILWEYTGYPGFWNIPQDGDTPTECLRTQLRRYFISLEDPNGR